MTDATARSGLVVSDLHLFSGRSEGERLFGEIRSQAGELDALVLNGDTFDFRWSLLSSESATIEAAIRWLEAILVESPIPRVHFLLGNHDCLADFRRELEGLAKAFPRLHCHEFQLRLGDNLFLHGDCANRRMNAAALEKSRRSWSRDRQRGRIAATIYDSADSLGLSRRFHDLYFPRTGTVKRVVHHLDRVLPGWRDRIRHCYFGHTHRPFRDHQWKGIRFSNTGSGIRGMGFQPLEFRWSPDRPDSPSDSSQDHERKSHLLF